MAGFRRVLATLLVVVPLERRRCARAVVVEDAATARRIDVAALARLIVTVRNARARRDADTDRCCSTS